MSSKHLRGKWLWPWFQFANLLILRIERFISSEEVGLLEKSNHSRHTYLISRTWDQRSIFVFKSIFRYLLDTEPFQMAFNVLFRDCRSGVSKLSGVQWTLQRKFLFLTKHTEKIADQPSRETLENHKYFINANLQTSCVFSAELWKFAEFFWIQGGWSWSDVITLTSVIMTGLRPARNSRANSSSFCHALSSTMKHRIIT